MKGKNLVIVESPAKAKTINKYLGKDFLVLASLGHVKDLPKTKFGVDVDHDFRPDYLVIKGKGKVMTDIKAAARGSRAVFLAPDPDREGEAIAWHIANELPVPEERIFRVTFNEITSSAVRKAFESPGRLDQNKVDAQQARRILDRIVGYRLSPILWKKVKKGLSAGRVQSVALRLVCEREQEIGTFESREYWTVGARLATKDGAEFNAKLEQVGGTKARIATHDEAAALVDRLRPQPFVVGTVATAKKRRNPAPPFITSHLQQEAYRRLRFTARKTMTLAQRLYEGVELPGEGQVALITYMRTDSFRVASEAQQEALSFIRSEFGDEYAPSKPNTYAARKKTRVQDAHECVRPTSALRRPESVAGFLDRDLARLYELIWTRFVASQMTPAQFEEVTAEIPVEDCLFKARGIKPLFDGHLRVFADQPTREENGEAEGPANGEEAPQGNLPRLAGGDSLRLLELEKKQHFTQPPPRYTEASLIRTLEEKGIGRPSTYATILTTIQSRDYTTKEKGRLHPTELGQLVNGLLVEHFPEIFNVEFTAGMEDRLDLVEEGKRGWVETLREFYEPFSRDIEKAEQEMKNVKQQVETTDIACEKCGKPMVIRWGRNGKFLACSGYPECRNTKNFSRDEGNGIRVIETEATDVTCEKCGKPMVIKQGRFGRFLACTGYPECKQTSPLSQDTVPCPVEGCTGRLLPRVTKRRRRFWGCNRYPDCDYATWNQPVAVPCPACGSPTSLVKKADGDLHVCARKECGHEFTPGGAEAGGR